MTDEYDILKSNPAFKDQLIDHLSTEPDLECPRCPDCDNLFGPEEETVGQFGSQEEKVLVIRRCTNYVNCGMIRIIREVK